MADLWPAARRAALAAAASPTSASSIQPAALAPPPAPPPSPSHQELTIPIYLSFGFYYFSMWTVAICEREVLSSKRTFGEIIVILLNKEALSPPGPPQQQCRPKN